MSRTRRNRKTHKAERTTTWRPRSMPGKTFTIITEPAGGDR